MTTRCKFCQFDNDQTSVFCKNCGKELKWSKIKDVNYSVQYNPNFFSTDNPRGILEILRLKNKEDWLLLISFVLNFVTPLLFYDSSSQLFTSANNVFILTIFVVFLLISFSEPKNIGARLIMILINFYYYVFALFTFNVILFLIAIYQISIKAFNSQFYSIYSNLYKVDQRRNYLKITLFFSYFSIPRILQGPGVNPEGWSINSSGSTNFFSSTGSIPYFLWICFFAFIFLLIVVNKSWERFGLIKNVPLTQKTATAIFVLVIIGISFSTSTNNLNIDKSHNPYSLSAFSSSNQNSIAYIENMNTFSKSLLVVQNLKTNVKHSTVIPQCYSGCTINFISDNSVVVGYININYGKVLSPMTYPSTFIIFNFNNGKVSENSFTAQNILISNQTVYSLNNNWTYSTNYRIIISSVNNAQGNNFVINVNQNFNYYFLSSDLTKLGIEDFNTTYTSLNYFNLIKSTNSTELIPKFQSGIHVKNTASNNIDLQLINWNFTTNSLIYGYSTAIPNTTQIDIFNFNTNKSNTVANIPGTLNVYSINEQYKLLFGTSFEKIYPYSYNNSSSSNADPSFFKAQFWNAQNLIGIYPGNGKWILTTFNPISYKITLQTIPFTYINQDQINSEILINSVSEGLFFITLFVCVILIINDYRNKYLAKSHIKSAKLNG